MISVLSLTLCIIIVRGVGATLGFAHGIAVNSCRFTWLILSFLYLPLPNAHTLNRLDRGFAIRDNSFVGEVCRYP